MRLNEILAFRDKRFAACASVPPVGAHATAHSVGQAGLYGAFLASLVPRLQLEISRIGRRAAEGNRDAVVELEVDEQAAPSGLPVNASQRGRVYPFWMNFRAGFF